MPATKPQGSLLFHMCGSGSALFDLTQLEKMPEGKLVKPIYYKGNLKENNLLGGGKLTVGAALLKFR
jgi:hypothetical protein